MRNLEQLICRSYKKPPISIHQNFRIPTENRGILEKLNLTFFAWWRKMHIGNFCREFEKLNFFSLPPNCSLFDSLAVSNVYNDWTIKRNIGVFYFFFTNYLLAIVENNRLFYIYLYLISLLCLF